MTLLEALVEAVEPKKIGITHARLVHFAVADDGDVAFLSQLDTDELVPVLERWCEARRLERRVH